MTRQIGTGTYRYVGICRSRGYTDKVSRYQYLQVVGICGSRRCTDDVSRYRYPASRIRIH
jgi:hypothetical protein